MGFNQCSIAGCTNPATQMSVHGTGQIGEDTNTEKFQSDLLCDSCVERMNTLFKKFQKISCLACTNPLKKGDFKPVKNGNLPARSLLPAQKKDQIETKFSNTTAKLAFIAVSTLTIFCLIKIKM